MWNLKSYERKYLSTFDNENFYKSKLISFLEVGLLILLKMYIRLLLSLMMVFLLNLMINLLMYNLLFNKKLISTNLEHQEGPLFRECMGNDVIGSKYRASLCVHLFFNLTTYSTGCLPVGKTTT